MVQAEVKHVKIEDFAKLIHDADREAVEKGKMLMRKKCSYVHSVMSIFCEEGELYKGDDFYAKATGETCPRCNGTGFEPFLSWNEITDDAMEGRRIQARFIDGKVIVVNNELVRAAVVNCYDQIRAEILAEACSRIDDDDVRGAAIDNAFKELDRFKRMVESRDRKIDAVVMGKLTEDYWNAKALKPAAAPKPESLCKTCKNAPRDLKCLFKNSEMVGDDTIKCAGYTPDHHEEEICPFCKQSIVLTDDRKFVQHNEPGWIDKTLDVCYPTKCVGSCVEAPAQAASQQRAADKSLEPFRRNQTAEGDNRCVHYNRVSAGCFFDNDDCPSGGRLPCAGVRKSKDGD